MHRLAPPNPLSPRSLFPSEDFGAARREMVEKQLRRRGIADARVLAAMAAVPREEFVPPSLRARAYDDSPLPIGEEQTISQPYIVAAMSAALALKGSERVLEVGAGCGYQSAVLSRLAAEVIAVEFRSGLARAAVERLERLGCRNVHVHCGDGTLGLPEFAPYHAILVAAAAPAVPPPLFAQLAEGGRLILPVGTTEEQELRLVEKIEGQFRTCALDLCRFVPISGRYSWRPSP